MKENRWIGFVAGGGCISSLLSFLVLIPLFYYILWSILKTIDAPNSLWIAFWIYAILSVVVKLAIDIFGLIAKAIND